MPNLSLHKKLCAVHGVSKAGHGPSQTYTVGAKKKLT